MNIINTLTWRSLKLNRKRTIVTIIGIILSGAMICGTFTLAASFQDVFVQEAIKTQGNFHAAFFNVNPEQIKYITDNTYTKKSMLSGDLGYARFERSTSKTKPYFFVREYDDTAFRQMPVQLTAGRFPEKAGEILLSKEILKHGGEAYQIGDAITFALGERINEGQQLPFDSSLEETEQFKATAAKKTYTVTGLMAKPAHENIYGIPGFTVLAYLDQSSPAAKPVTVSIQGKNPRQIYDKVPQMAKNAGIEHYDYNDELLKWMGISKYDSVKAMLYSITAIVIALIAVGSVIVIYNAFAISVSERKKQFGMLAGVGATPGQIRRSVFFEGAILALAGIPAGILSGIGGIAVTFSVVNRLASGMIGIEDVALRRLIVSPGVILGSIVFMALLIFISAYIPAKRASSASPIEAIRLSSDIKIKGKAMKTSRLSRLLWGFEGELALKNLKRNRRRYRTTVLSLFISIVLFISFSSFLNYGFTGTNMYFQEGAFDLSVTLNNASPEEQAAFYKRIAALDGVERYATARMVFAESWLTRSRFGSYLQEKHLDEQKLFPVNKKNQYRCTVRITALGEAEFKAYAAENGIDAAAFQDTKKLRGILINKNVLREAGKHTGYEPLQAKTGEKLLLTTASGVPAPPAPVPFSMEIGAITDTLPLGVAYTEPAEVNMVVSEAAFPVLSSLLTDETMRSGNEAELFICADNSAAPGDLAERIRTIFEDYSGHCSLHLYDVQAEQNNMERAKKMISIFLYGFVTLITLIGVTNIFNTISTNIALRRREFAMLQSVGLTPRGFNKMINYESVFYGLKALLYGLPVGILISMLLHSSFSEVFEFAFFLPGKEILACVIGVFGIVFITMLHAGAKLKNDNIIEALRAENL